MPLLKNVSESHCFYNKVKTISIYHRSLNVWVMPVSQLIPATPPFTSHLPAERNTWESVECISAHCCTWAFDFPHALCPDTPTLSSFLLRAYVRAKLLSHVLLSPTAWTIARQGPLSMGFSGQEYWSRLSLPSSRGSSPPRDQTLVSYISCFGRCVLYH